MNAKKRILLFLSVLVLLSSSVFAAEGILSGAHEAVWNVFQSTPAVMFITFAFYLMLFYAIVAAGISRVKVFGESGQPNKFGKIVAVSMSGLMTTGIFFYSISKGLGPEEVLVSLLNPFGIFAGFLLAALVFLLIFFGLREENKTHHWEIALFAGAVTLIFFGMVTSHPNIMYIGWMIAFIIALIMIFASKADWAPSFFRHGPPPTSRTGRPDIPSVSTGEPSLENRGTVKAVIVDADGSRQKFNDVKLALHPVNPDGSEGRSLKTDLSNHGEHIFEKVPYGHYLIKATALLRGTDYVGWSISGSDLRPSFFTVNRKEPIEVKVRIIKEPEGRLETEAGFRREPETISDEIRRLRDTKDKISQVNDFFLKTVAALDESSKDHKVFTERKVAEKITKEYPDTLNQLRNSLKTLHDIHKKDLSKIHESENEKIQNILHRLEGERGHHYRDILLKVDQLIDQRKQILNQIKEMFENLHSGLETLIKDFIEEFGEPGKPGWIQQVIDEALKGKEEAIDQIITTIRKRLMPHLAGVMSTIQNIINDLEIIDTKTTEIEHLLSSVHHEGREHRTETTPPKITNEELNDF